MPILSQCAVWLALHLEHNNTAVTRRASAAIWIFFSRPPHVRTTQRARNLSQLYLIPIGVYLNPF